MSASLIGWIVSLVFIAMVAVGFLIGMWRGLKRSTVSLVVSIIGVVIAFFITPLITNAILGVQIPMNGKTMPLREIALELFMQNEDMASLAEKNPNLQTFMLNLPQAIINVVMFMVVTAVLEGILYAVYKILSKTAFKLKEDEKKRKIAGGIVGAVKTLIIVVIAFMPFSALIGVASNCLNKGDYGINPATEQVATLADEPVEEGKEKVDRGVLADAVPEIALTMVDGLENNLLTKMAGLFGMDNALFDYYGNFEVAEQKIIVRQEIENVYNVVDLSMQLSKVDSTYSFKDFNYKKISEEYTKLSSSPMFKNVLAETLGEIIMNYKDYEFIANSQFAQDYAEVLDAVSLGLKAYTAAGGSVGDYFNDDITQLANVATAIGESGAIDDIMALETVDAPKALGVLTNDEYFDVFKASVDKIFEMNLIRDAVDEVANKFLPQVSEDVDEIGVSTDDWQDADWKSLSSSVSSIVKSYASVANKISILDVLGDATILLDKNENYDIVGILSELGALIDDARAVNLLQTSEGKPIIDKLLTKHNMTLPSNVVVKNNGEVITISKYGGTNGLFDFVAPSLVLLRDEDVYTSVTAENSTNEKLTSLAVIVSKEGNETLLSEIIMPLYQVEPTKTLIVNQLTSGLNSDLINFTVLANYEDWKKDLDYISVILKVLNSRPVMEEGEMTTYLQLVLNGKLDAIVDNLIEQEVEAVIKPVFYAKSTSKVKENILSAIESDLKEITEDNNLTISATGVTFDATSLEDQTQELCDVLKKILPLKSAMETAQGEIKDVDKTILGQMLNAMKENAYRVELSADKTEKLEQTGLFKSAFESLMTKMKSEYSTEVALLESQPDLLEEELGVRSLESANYYKIDFEKLMTMLAEL